MEFLFKECFLGLVFYGKYFGEYIEIEIYLGERIDKEVNL